MNTSALDKINSRYNPEHDMGPDAPVHWSVAELANLVSKLVDKIEEQQEQINSLLDAVPSAKRQS